MALVRVCPLAVVTVHFTLSAPCAVRRVSVTLATRGPASACCPTTLRVFVVRASESCAKKAGFSSSPAGTHRARGREGGPGTGAETPRACTPPTGLEFEGTSEG